jgi:hypothetical protein
VTGRPELESACDCRKRIDRPCLDMCTLLPDGEYDAWNLCAFACWDSVALNCGFWRRLGDWVYARWPGY